MKSSILKILVFLLFATSVFANAGDALTDTSEAVAKALLTFKEDNSADVVSKFKGVKAAPNSHGVTITIYLTVGDSIGYGCHRHEDNDPFECHETN